MNKQELLKQADYTFQRGNRELAKKYLADLIAAYPNEEAAWMLLARVEEKKERKVECYQRVLKINPNNNEAKIALVRIHTPHQNHDIGKTRQTPLQKSLRGAAVFGLLALTLVSASFFIARSNPNSRVAQLIIPATPTAYTETLTGDIASKTRSEISAKYPQYSALVDTLISLAVKSAENGMDGAPERPGAAIIPSDQDGEQARTQFEKSLPQPGSLSSVTLSEQQLTSWLTLEMENNPDLPLSDIQVYLRDDTIQIWGVVQGSSNSTSALIKGQVIIDASNNPSIDLESIQIGSQAIPDVLVTQAEGWLNQLLAEKIAEQVPGLQLMNINISSGLITISGMR